MAKESVLALKNCKQCLIFEADVQTLILAPITATKPMDLVHIDFIKMEIPGDLRKKPKTKMFSSLWTISPDLYRCT